MGAEPWFYFVPHEPDVRLALEKLKQREFAAGRYFPAMAGLSFPVDADTPGPGAQHETIDEAREEAAEQGTMSILDMEAVGDEPDFCVAAPLPPETLIELYGTAQPTREQLADLAFFESLERGHGVYVTVYRAGRPSEILFAGYSFD